MKINYTKIIIRIVRAIILAFLSLLVANGLGNLILMTVIEDYSQYWTDSSPDMLAYFSLFVFVASFIFFWKYLKISKGKEY